MKTRFRNQHQGFNKHNYIRWHSNPKLQIILNITIRKALRLKRRTFHHWNSGVKLWLIWFWGHTNDRAPENCHHQKMVRKWRKEIFLIHLFQKTNNNLYHPRGRWIFGSKSTWWLWNAPTIIVYNNERPP